MRQRLVNLMVAVDQLAWVIVTLGIGMPDETISAALYRMEKDGKRAGRWFRPVVDFLFSWAGPTHCREAYLDELYMRQLPRIYRELPK